MVTGTSRTDLDYLSRDKATFSSGVQTRESTCVAVSAVFHRNPAFITVIHQVALESSYLCMWEFMVVMMEVIKL